MLGRHAVGRDLVAHATLHRSTSSSGHRSRGIDDLAIERDDAEALPGRAEREALALLEVGRDERVGEELEEARGEFGVFDGDEVEEARGVLGRLDGRHVA